MSYPDAVIRMYAEYMRSVLSGAIEAALVKHDNTRLFPGG